MSTRTGRPSTSHTILQLPDTAVSADVPYPLAKRAFDRGVAAALAVVLSPVFLVAVVLIGLDQLLVAEDRGRWLYRERRISRGREFDVLKFRVLREDVLAEIMWRVVYADGNLSHHEEALLRKIGSLLDLKPGYLATARKRAMPQDPPGPPPPGPAESPDADAGD